MCSPFCTAGVAAGSAETKSSSRRNSKSTRFPCHECRVCGCNLWACWSNFACPHACTPLVVQFCLGLGHEASWKRLAKAGGRSWDALGYAWILNQQFSKKIQDPRLTLPLTHQLLQDMQKRRSRCYSCKQNASKNSFSQYQQTSSNHVDTRCDSR